MSGRVTPSKDPDEFPSLKERNPAMFWVGIVVCVAMVLSLTGGYILMAVL